MSPTKPRAARQPPHGKRFGEGQKGNPGGLTADERAARDALRQALASDDMRELGLKAYRQLLQEGNPVIVKDFMDRVAGKAVERVQLEEPTEVPPMSPEWALAVLAALGVTT